VTRFRRPSCVTIGTFDGVHLGHQAVIKRVVEQAMCHDLNSVVMTFDPHPRLSLGKGSIPPLLTSTPHKLRLLKELGVSVCLLAELDRNLATMSPTDFVVEIFCQKLAAARMVIGPRLRFGKGRRGTLTLLKKLGERFDFGVEVVDEVFVDDVPVSSTMIRERVLRGDLPAAEALLGRRFSVLGRVVRGRNLGRVLGYRTANVRSLDDVLPPTGVYAVEVVLNQEKHPGALNLGWQPTFHSPGHRSPVPEVHVLDFDRPIYRKQIEIVFHRRLREERQFATPEDLGRQIALDIEAVRRYFGREAGGRFGQ
jgi:riboflavin kinase/FMN adenylyltransferase